MIATGVQYSVRQFITWSAAELGYHLEFQWHGVEEIATVAADRYGRTGPSGQAVAM